MGTEISEDDDNGSEVEMTKAQKFRQWMSNWCDLIYPRL
jgi:hypothetical protein